MIRNTSHYPDAEVRSLVNFAAGHIDTSDVAINVKNSSRAYAGRAYQEIPYQSPYARKRMYRGKKLRYLVVVRIGKPEKFPVNSGTKHLWRRVKEGEEYKPHEVRSVSRTKNGVTESWLEKVSYVPYGGVGAPLDEMRDWREALIWLTAHELMHVQQFRFKAPHSEMECEKAGHVKVLAWREREAMAAAACSSSFAT